MKLAAILFITCVAAYGNDRCLAVYPVQNNRAQSMMAGGVIGLAFAHGQQFAYLDSKNVSVSDVKTRYKKKDLVKLEKQGVTVIVTTQGATPPEGFTLRVAQESVGVCK